MINMFGSLRSISFENDESRNRDPIARHDDAYGIVAVELMPPLRGSPLVGVGDVFQGLAPPGYRMPSLRD
jgi:hypothetical protein